MCQNRYVETIIFRWFSFNLEIISMNGIQMLNIIRRDEKSQTA